MPIEIKELHIRINVTPPVSQGESGAPGGSQERAGRLTRLGKQEIIAECIEQVMKILENKKER